MWAKWRWSGWEQSAAEDAGDEEEPQRTLTTKRMAEAFRKIQQGMQIFSDDDPNRELSGGIVKKGLHTTSSSTHPHSDGEGVSILYLLPKTVPICVQLESRLSSYGE
ncbi:hypothetical protein Hamer_G022717 [Homarus americanus]|uniref:Uncharacterized protein n=1 Tax=Homarus americanus TaxID=6706 RepID=A0A8J5N9M6_HOMAM|nr:hypothetical protein Hamer_G022717 [Homarus americanus]